MNALFFPYLPRNPYQPNLAKALEEKGVSVTGVKDISLRSFLASVKGQDILHLHWTHPYLLAAKVFPTIRKSFCFFLVLVFQKVKGKKLIWTIHNLGEHEKRHPLFELYCHKFLAWLADGIIVHSQYARKKVIDVYRLGHQTDKIAVIPHGHYIDNYPNQITPTQARDKLGIEAD
ncbi:MAG: glycosyltransferase, partial [Deltaproteobacteria bacterium]|nr:glycosyltransferase [Deltaproteobacteria bacterium]